MITVTLFCREMSYVAIYALSGKKIIGQKFACVNFLTNIMSAPDSNAMLILRKDKYTSAVPR